MGGEFRAGRAQERRRAGRVRLVLRVEDPVAGEIGRPEIDRAPVVRHHREAGGLEGHEAHLGDLPGEEGEYLVEGVGPLTVGHVCLIEGAVAPTDAHVHVGKRSFVVDDGRGIPVCTVRLPDAVSVQVVEDVVLLPVEPLEDRHVPEGAQAVGRVARATDDRDPLERDDQVERRVPYHELVVPVGNVGDREFAVSVRRRRVDSRADPTSRKVVQPHPGGSVAEAHAVVEGVVRRTRHVQVDHRSGDGAATVGRSRDRVELLGEADEDVRARRSELGEEGGLVGLDPRVDDRSALDGGGLLPALPRRRDRGDAVLARRQVVDMGPAVRAGVDAAPDHVDARGIVRVAPREIGRPQGVAVYVGGLDSRGSAIAAACVLQLDREAAHVPAVDGRVFRRRVRRAIDRLVVLEDENRDLRRRDRVRVDVGGEGGVAAFEPHPADGVARPRQDRDEVVLVGIGRERKLVAGGLRRYIHAPFRHHRHVALVEADRQGVGPVRVEPGIGGIDDRVPVPVKPDVIGPVLLHQPAVVGDGCLDAAGSHAGRAKGGIVDPLHAHHGQAGEVRSPGLERRSCAQQQNRRDDDEQSPIYNAITLTSSCFSH